MLVLIIISIICIIKKKKTMPIIFGFQLLKSFLIIATAPDCFFMYYLPIYLTGYFILVLSILNIFNNKDKEEKNSILI